MKTSLRTSNLPPWVRQLRIMKQKPQLQEQRWRHFGEELFVLPLSWLDKTFEDLGKFKGASWNELYIYYIFTGRYCTHKQNNRSNYLLQHD